MKCVLPCGSLWGAIRTSYWERSVPEFLPSPLILSSLISVLGGPQLFLWGHYSSLGFSLVFRWCLLISTPTPLAVRNNVTITSGRRANKFQGLALRPLETVG